LSYERLFKTDKQQSDAQKIAAMEYFQKVLQLDPADAQATEVVNELKKPEVKKKVK
jgi:DNA-directed RNA polymerase subunit F